MSGPEKGVATVEPPEDRLGPIMRAVAQAVAELPKGTNGALVAIANEQGANLAVVSKLPGSEAFAVQAWVGKRWDGPLDYGAAVKVTW